ncbi:hypothetical protein [Pseudomonas sp. 22 E 5]|nr:hypothetical protein [Pseudomonas sp. 22 E 5]
MLANAACQAVHQPLTHPYRRQASSHSGSASFFEIGKVNDDCIAITPPALRRGRDRVGVCVAGGVAAGVFNQLFRPGFKHRGLAGNLRHRPAFRPAPGGVASAATGRARLVAALEPYYPARPALAGTRLPGDCTGRGGPHLHHRLRPLCLSRRAHQRDGAALPARRADFSTDGVGNLPGAVDNRLLVGGSGFMGVGAGLPGAIDPGSCAKNHRQTHSGVGVRDQCGRGAAGPAGPRGQPQPGKPGAAALERCVLLRQQPGRRRGPEPGAVFVRHPQGWPVAIR